MKKEKKGFIYLLTNLVNGKKYVGQHYGVTAETRWNGHVKAAMKGGCELVLHRAIRKYGVHNFSAEVVWTGARERLNDRETFYVAKFHSFIDDELGGGYNLTRGGKQGEFSMRSRKKLSAALRKTFAERPWVAEERSATVKARFADPEERRRLSDALKRSWLDPGRKKPSRAARKRQAEATRAQWLDPERHARHAVAVQASYARDPERGSRLSIKLKTLYKKDPSIRQKAGAKSRGLRRSADTVEKIKANTKAQWSDPIRKAALVDALKRGAARRWASAESRKVNSAGLLRAWSDPEKRKNFLEGQRRRRARERAEKEALARG